MDVYANLKQLNIELPAHPKPGGIYSPVVQFGDCVYTSGNGCKINGQPPYVGLVGREVTVEQAQFCARQSILNLLSVLDAYLGDLNRIKRFVKILGFVASDTDFHMQPKVMDAASQLLVDIFGEEVGKAARSAIGTNSLPANMPVEIELVAELKK